MFLGASAIIALLLFLILVPYIIPISSLQKTSSEPIPIFLVVILAGTMGAFFSSLQRLYDFKELPQVLYNKDLGDEYGTLFVYSLIPVLVGGIAAAVIYLVFAGGLLSGSFFPAFNCNLKADCTHFSALLADYGPKEAPDYAKAILWGFIAGFAERLVPSLLGSFAHDASEQATKSHSEAVGAARPAGEGRTASASPVSAQQAESLGTSVPSPNTASRGLANQT